MSLQRLSARIEELEAQRAELEATLSSIAAPASPPPPIDWEARLSAAKAVDALTGSATASTVEAQRQADLAQREQQARKADGEALQATQRREAMESLTRDLEAATALYQRELRAVASQRVADFEAGYHRARDEVLATARDLAAMLYLAGQESAAHQLLRSAGVAGDTMTIIAQAAIPLRAKLLEETDHA